MANRTDGTDPTDLHHAPTHHSPLDTRHSLSRPTEVADGGGGDAEGFLEGVREMERVSEGAARGDFLHEQVGVLQERGAALEACAQQKLIRAAAFEAAEQAAQIFRAHMALRGGGGDGRQVGAVLVEMLAATDVRGVGGRARGVRQARGCIPACRVRRNDLR